MNGLDKTGKNSKEWREKNKPKGASEPKFPYKDMSVVGTKEIDSPASFLFESQVGQLTRPRNIFNARLTLAEPS
jgi:hypothetical protein